MNVFDGGAHSYISTSKHSSKLLNEIGVPKTHVPPDTTKEEHDEPATAPAINCDKRWRPVIVKGNEGRLTDAYDDYTLFLFSYRSDRMREIAVILGRQADGGQRPQNIARHTLHQDLRGTHDQQNITAMSRHNAEIPFNVAEELRKQGVKQASIAEADKCVHVTFLFNGGGKKQFKNEERRMIASPKVATYDKLPKKSVHGVAEKAAEVLKDGSNDFVVGHASIYDAAAEAITEMDKVVGTFHAGAQEAEYILLVTTDHGNAEQMMDLETGAIRRIQCRSS
ncbi:hypothetical protein DXG01_015615 [Tephrocybe rancida]|nr:hypothetical protein DXG01_015615 [Tephrocybe rancida]